MSASPPKDDDLLDRLEAYQGKEYSEIIEFPVELVDRDGVVRRYSYEESLAVYRRRIQSAPWRYAEDSLVAAEIGHCSQRISQLKRSFRATRDGGKLSPMLRPRAVLGEGYEVLRRFYSKVLHRRGLRLEGELDLQVTLVQDEAKTRIYHVSVGQSQQPGAGHLLYVYPFDRVGDQDPTEKWQEARDSFSAHQGTGVEQLLLAEEGAGAGFLLTGQEAVPPGLRAVGRTPLDSTNAAGIAQDHSATLVAAEAPLWPGLDDDRSEPSPPGFDEGVIAFQEDRLEEAALAFQAVLQDHPYHRESYLALLGILDGLDRSEEAEFYAEMASHHLPNDGLIYYRKSIHQVRLGNFEEAVALLDEASALETELHQPAFFAGHLLLAHIGDLEGADSRLSAASALADPSEEAVHRSSSIVAKAIRFRKRLRRIGWVAMGLSCAIFLRVPTVGLFGLLLSVAALRGAAALPVAWARTQVRRLALEQEVD